VLSANSQRNKAMSNVNLNDAVLIDCSFTGCGGTRTIADGKIMVDEIAIDAEGVTSKKLQWFPSEALSFKDKHNKRIRRYFETIGIPTSLGIVIDKDKLQEAEDFINKETAEFFAEVDIACNNYDVTLEQHAISANNKSGNEHIGKIIKLVAMSKEDFKNTFKVTSMPPLVLSTTSKEGAVEFSKILTDGALTRLMETAKKLFSKSYAGKEQTTESATKATFELKDMVYNLSFANPDLAFIADQFSDVLDGVNPHGKHAGMTFYAMRSFVSELSTEQGLTRILDGEMAKDIESEAQADDEDNASTDVAVESDEADTPTQTTPTSHLDKVNEKFPLVVEVNPTVKKTKPAHPTKPNTPSEDIAVDTKPTIKPLSPGKLGGFGNF